MLCRLFTSLIFRHLPSIEGENCYLNDILVGVDEKYRHAKNLKIYIQRSTFFITTAIRV